MEKWKEYYSKKQIENVQKVELKIFDDLTDVCKKLDIKFFAYGGTLIGAVRHKGFVPWDDDFDIGMLRKDYEKFIREAPGILPEEYFLQNPAYDKKTPYLYTKLRLKGTEYIEYGYHNLKIEKGIYADIYPIDNLPDSDKKFHRQFSAFRRLAVLYSWRQCPYMQCENENIATVVKGWVKKFISAVLNVVPERFFVEKSDKIATMYNDKETSRKGNLYYPKPTNIFYDLLPFEDGSFEGKHIYLPGGWDSHLTSRYGEYMKMPPEEKRIGHKPYLLDFGKYKI